MKSNVSIADKLNVLQAHIGPMMDALGTMAKGNDLTADDLVEFFAMGIAAVIDNDTNVRSPRDIRKASEASTKLIEQRARDFRALHEATGISALDILCPSYPLGQAVAA
jgi:uncharacterized protein (UPF0147 family)